MTMEVSEYGYTFQDKAGFAIFGLIAVSISVVLFATGWIIQAISFLPGKGDATLVSQEAPLELTVGEALPASPSEESPSLLAWLVVGGGIVMALAAVLMLAL
ncbi:hypothetical protein [Sphingobium sp.]|uniref:hypothetical protein n=1 Tax=Sphingobium sp. TaxID=1912891 RepID=UPI00263642F0|nr:hypothetical protein [Sphingobium sp.]